MNFYKALSQYVTRCLSLSLYFPPRTHKLIPYLFTTQTRAFDIFDILANLIGSGLGILLCIWYHKRMLDRRRLARSTYQPVAEDEIEFDQEAQELNDITSTRPRDGSEDGDEGGRK